MALRPNLLVTVYINTLYFLIGIGEDWQCVACDIVTPVTGWEMDSLTGLCKLSIFVNYPRFYIYSKLLHKMLVYFVIPIASGMIKIK